MEMPAESSVGYRERAPRIDAHLDCFLLHRDLSRPVLGKIVNESNTGCLIQSSKQLPPQVTVTILVSGVGRGIARVREGKHIIHGIVVRTGTEGLYGIRKLEQTRNNLS